ncbi:MULTISPECIES: translation initiation factor IF-2 N-terminal domain-containing protein [Nostoc]|uniref:Translation initiation factor IF-2 N-terminal domain-containing protein n=1 Tax=Nostoc paludosum FACHB-159 TaxID=2692908 RepID=A0ABR8K2B7_9NOSO|nr:MULTISPECIES: translation initiation factor IF-2 N-terminal domain-containing protein [Nostoc]MBD2676870.1 translation initiation factor IF-2 N-terminal domain-containing protein [Nostoc sp. FACHB-857]MBD2733068.1 translation initiation factor IF-2 N-terminal domain-containing protein [Nostoc paludosum FACHB-159]
MNKVKLRIYELSKELNLDSKKLLVICEKLNIAVKSHTSSISESEAERIRLAVNKLTAKSAKTKTSSEDWGYTFVGSTIDRLIRNLEGESALQAYPEFRERREHANELMFECVGKKPCLFYVRRKGAGKDPKEEIWDLTIATDSENFQLPPRLEKLRKTLGFTVAVQKDGRDGLKILSAHLLQLSRGNADSYSVAFPLRLLPNHQHHLDIPPTTLTRIAAAPVCGDNVPTEDQLKAWKAFLQIEEKIAKARQFCVRYISHNYNHKRRINFEIDVTSATLDGFYQNSLELENFWERAKQAKNEDLKLFETAPIGKNWMSGRQLGTIEEIDPNRCIISVRLERDLAEYMTTERYKLPATGFLCFEAVGDIQQIQRKKKALEDLNNGYTQNPYLGNFLFDASQARKIKTTIEIQPQDLLLSAANPGQKAAVEKVLAAKDLVLIQGPPGTGKTTVIAEICYQVALRGGRTLIASQANLAVDNALSRLVHNPVIRAVRKGKAEKVGEEGQPFLEDQVIGRWLENTANDCENNLNQRLENIELFRKLLSSSERFTAYLQAEEKFDKELSKFQKNKLKIESNFKNQEKSYNDSLAAQNEVESLISGLDNILNTVTNVNWESPEITNFLPLLKPYAEGNSLVEEFLANVRKSIKCSDELGFVRPAFGAFGLAIWLRETIATEILQFKTALNSAQSASENMSAVAALAQTVKQNFESLNQLQADYQKFITKQQNLQQTIQIWQNRQREIDYIISAVKEWKSTAHSHLYQTLKDCQQSGLPLTDNLVDLPLGLLMFANTLKLPIVPKNYKINLPDWDLLTKAIAYEIDGNFADRRGKQHNFSYFLQQNFSQIPMVLSQSDRTQWQETYQQFNNYQLLNPKQRKLLVENTQFFLIRMQKTYGASWEWNNIDSTLTRITQELLETILANARQCVLKVKTETEQQLHHLHQQLNELQKNEISQQQISTTQYQLEKTQQDANCQLAQVLNILQELSQQPNIPNQLRTLAEQYLTTQSKIWEQPQEFANQVHCWVNCISQLETLISLIEPFAVLEVIKTSLHEHLAKLKQETENSLQQLQKLQISLRELEQQLQPQPSESLIAQRNWWLTEWQTIPDKFKPENSNGDFFNIDFLQSLNFQFESWQQQLQKEEAYLNKYQNFVQDWIKKLRQPTEGDSDDLRRIYLDNANVVGITCVQAANRGFSEEFKSFDVVIIDEVSKCTPPELLIPALKGKKLVMVGDHRQLPPMLDTSTLEEVAQAIGNTRDELQFLEESLFKSQFESADESIKQMLTTQYRMHPYIMGAINQFYDGKLESGILEPDRKRAHHLAGEIIQESHHILWVKTPIEKKYLEERHGTSYFNTPEIDAIERLCQQFEKTWASQVANGEPKKEIAVITFYGAQLRKIDERLQSELFPSLEIRTGTVDRFQGMERPVVIVSMVRNNNKGDVGFAKKPERVNVAFSRAQELLIIVGCHDLFTHQAGKVGNMYSEVSNIVSLREGFVDVSRII